jgi:single-strand DNA-binding protein
MQQVTGRLTADAVVAATKSGKEVVNFRIADNETYRRKGEDKPVKITTYFNCAYWLNTAVAKVLRKGAVVQLNGRMSGRAYQTNTGETGVSLDFNTSRIEVLAYAVKGSEVAIDKDQNSADKQPQKANGKKQEPENKDDMPF